jgi:type I restriction enzyme S subunit
MSEWRTTTWGAVTALEYGKALRGYQDSVGDVRVYGTNGPVGWTSTRQASGPGVIIGRKGAYRGVHYSANDFWVIDTAYYLRPLESMSLRWAYYALMNLDINSMDSGSAIPSTSRADFYALPALVPPLVQQEAIAQVLGALDDKIAVNERIAAASLELAKGSYATVDTSDLHTVGDVTQVFDGPHATPEKVSEGPWFLSISSLQGGLLELSESAYISEEDFSRWTRRVQPTVGDVLFSYETRLGEAALMPSGVQACLGRRMGLLRSTNPSVTGPVLLHAFLGESFQEEIRRRTIHGATVDRIPLKELPFWPILLPSKSVLPRISSTLESFHRAAEHAQRESRTLATLRDTLLPLLMSSRLRVKDAEKIVEDHT